MLSLIAFRMQITSLHTYSLNAVSLFNPMPREIGTKTALVEFSVLDFRVSKDARRHYLRKVKYRSTHSELKPNVHVSPIAFT